MKSGIADVINVMISLHYKEDLKCVLEKALNILRWHLT